MKFLNKDGVTYLWGKIKTALNGKQDTLTFDNAPTANSDNPVKSGGIKAALDSKKNVQSAVSSPTASGNALAFIDTISQDAQGVIAATKKSVTVDATPTANSTNPVQSGGVKAALDGKQDALTLPLSIANGGTGANTADSARENLTAAKVNTAWKNAGNGITIYMYEGTGIAETYDIPVDTCIVLVMNTGKYRGEAIAFQWNESVTHMTRPLTWINSYHNSWKGWQQISWFETPIARGGTGATTADNAVKNLGLYSTSKATSFNSLPRPGIYGRTVECASGNKISDGPYPNSTNPQWWDVLCLSSTSNRAFQLATQIYANVVGERELWLRVLQDSAWKDWVRFARCPITANMGTVTGTGSAITITKYVKGVTANMTVDRIEFGTPSAVQSGWTVTTAANSVTFSATISGSTTVKIKLSDNTDITGT